VTETWTEQPYPPIKEYGLISDCHSMALISSGGSIDWCCMPRIDSGSCFGRILDWHKGGMCAIEARHGARPSGRRYMGETMVLETIFSGPRGSARLIDCFTMHHGGADAPHQELIRVLEGVEGEVALRFHIHPRFDYGALRPWLRRINPHMVAAIGGDDGLLISFDGDLVAAGHHELYGEARVTEGQRSRLVIRYRRPEVLDRSHPAQVAPELVDRRLEETIKWWEDWSSQATDHGPERAATIRSALVLKALTNAPTGAIAAAPTTSLPERVGGDRNWDYRYTWIRDSSFALRALGELGFLREADGFRRFIQRSSAGSGQDLQIMYGLGGERRLTEIELTHLEGYRGSKPVRIGNGASEQIQLDALGELLNLSWVWHRHHQKTPDADYWRFLRDLVEVACARWRDPDRGIWEIRGEPQHFVHSKVMCWMAIDRGLALARDAGLHCPLNQWEKEADELRRTIEEHGYDQKRGVFTQAFDSPAMDSVLLLLPTTGFIDYRDERMMRTVDAIREDLEEDGLLLRYRPDQIDDGVSAEREGQFLACTFWLSECLARQGRMNEARRAFNHASRTANDLGLLAEEYDPKSHQALGNFPQGLSHLSHLAARLALAGAPLPD
jgi:GH15 family glucan-1,4-alpha-glucosidase